MGAAGTETADRGIADKEAAGKAPPWTGAERGVVVRWPAGEGAVELGGLALEHSCQAP